MRKIEWGKYLITIHNNPKKKYTFKIEGKKGDKFFLEYDGQTMPFMGCSGEYVLVETRFDKDLKKLLGK